MNVREFFQRWKQGIETSSILSQLRAKRWGYRGQLAGLLLGGVMLTFNGLYYWLPLLAFSMLIILVDLVAVHQQIIQIERLVGDNGTLR